MSTETTQSDAKAEGRAPNPAALALSQSAPVRELARIQKERDLPDEDFARVVKFRMSGSSWGKIKAGNFPGNLDNAADAVRRSLTAALTGSTTAVAVDNGTVILDHVADAVAAVQLARVAKDDHRLVLIVGDSGAGKSATTTYLARRFDGCYMHAHPAWGRSYMAALAEIAEGIGLQEEFLSVRKAEAGILRDLRSRPRLLVIDEANHFNKDGINFLKAIINETRCALVLATLPNDFQRLNAEHSHETRQLVRRAVAITRIPAVDSAQVIALHCALKPNVHLNGHAPSIASKANAYHRIDTVIRILNEVDPNVEGDLADAIDRVEKAIKVSMVK